MRLKQISLSWFRGAALEATLAPDGKSVVVYGPNGAGKSTFADALEYVVRGGRIHHLSHEYSGSRQERGVRNTHTPTGERSRLELVFANGSSLTTEIESSGQSTVESSPANLAQQVQSWSVERCILRQDQVSDFIHKRKGEKYSALLPLLGLDYLENAAENLRQLGMHVKTEADLPTKTRQASERRRQIEARFRSVDRDAIHLELTALAKRYGVQATEGLEAAASALSTAITAQIAELQPQAFVHNILRQVKEAKLSEAIQRVREKEEAAAAEADAALGNKLAVLEKAEAFITGVDERQTEVDCPACGKLVSIEELRKHVAEELASLQTARSAMRAYQQARTALVATLSNVRTLLEHNDLKAWMAVEAHEPCRTLLQHIAKLNLEAWADHVPRTELDEFEDTIAPALAQADAFTATAPPTVNQLIADKEQVDVASSVSDLESLEHAVGRLEALVVALQASETAVRQAIRDQTTKVLADISDDVRLVWAKLHPGEPIDGIQLVIPIGVEKAVDIALQFHGVNQADPRLTLSEGHRNSLGLCVFLALVRDDDHDGPVILDDVVSSLDREHRGLLVEVLRDYFGDRQVIIMTHDREWYAELRARLPAKNWTFRILKSWEEPKTGLQWTETSGGFDHALSLLKTDVEASGNRIRAVMESELSVVAEKLDLRLPYLRGDKNDRRMVTEFIEAMISVGSSSFKVGDPSTTQYDVHEDGIATFRTARELLIAWANRGSHTGSLVEGEVKKLAKACQEARDALNCANCKDPVWISRQENRKRLQCSCGRLRWQL